MEVEVEEGKVRGERRHERWWGGASIPGQWCVWRCMSGWEEEVEEEVVKVRVKVQRKSPRHRGSCQLVSQSMAGVDAS